MTTNEAATAGRSTVTERDALRLLTLERTHCILCWSKGRRVQVISNLERVGRSQKAYKQLRRRRLARHLAEVHVPMQAERGSHDHQRGSRAAVSR